MASNIKTTGSIKDNFIATKQEIETLQVSKQDSLISGTNIKTLNGQSILGTGDIAAGSSVTLVTRAELETMAASDQIITNTLYAISDEGRVAVGTSTSTFSSMATQEELEQLTGATIRTPAAVSPAAGATDVDPNMIMLIGSEPVLLTGATVTGLQAQLSATADFSQIIHDSGQVTVSETDPIAFAPVASGLAVGTPAKWNPSYVVPVSVTASSKIYWRMRYYDSAGSYSAWTKTNSFFTKAISSFSIPTPTPANFGDPLDGGYYAGMIWNQIGQSTDTKRLNIIGNGATTFLVEPNSLIGVVYAGQQLEIRSRSNPDNKFIGTVRWVSSAELTIGVTKVEGPGVGSEFNDWSIMSRFRVIVSPKAQGEFIDGPFFRWDISIPTEAFSVNEGWLATNAIKNNSDATKLPAIHRARSLVINGYNDWYIPSRDELELIFRNLKPINVSNTVIANLNNTNIPHMLGSYGDVDTTRSNGVNKNSWPVGAAYTTDVPAQTLNPLFQEGGSEALSTDPYIGDSTYPQTYGSSTAENSDDHPMASGSGAYAPYTQTVGNYYTYGGQNKHDGFKISFRTIRRSII